MRHLIRSAAATFMVCAVPTLAANAPQPAVDLNQVMRTQVNPQGLALWDITNAASGDEGVVSAKKLTPNHWKRLLKIGQALQDGGQQLATTGKIRAAAPGVKLQSEGEPKAAKAADVQRWLDAKPAKFRELAMQLEKTGAGVVEAAMRRDVKKLGDLAGSLDEVCEACHVVFWYPNQPPPK